MHLLALLLSCGGGPTGDRVPVTLSPAPPMAGVAERTIDLPVGTPMGGYTSRCTTLGDDGEPGDKRDSAYASQFNVSAGVQMRMRAQALWLTNEQTDLVVLKADLPYSFDKLVFDLEERLGAATERDLRGRVVLTTSHSHNSYANFSDQAAFYLGGDRFQAENYQRLLATLESAALEAFDERAPAALGIGVAKDWDPDDQVYSDRRPENDELVMFDDIPEGEHKDPYLHVLRVDHADGTPMGVFFTFGIHGTILGADNAMLSSDATGGLERAVENHFGPEVVVAHWQGAGGDASPRGGDQLYASIEVLGERAAPPIVALWEQTATSTDPLVIDSIGVPVALGREMHVTRFGEVDWSYRPYEDNYQPDGEIWAADGSLLSPFDEFTPKYGAAFCGVEGDPLIAAGAIGAGGPYATCMDWELVAAVVYGIFDIANFDGIDAMPMPTPHSVNAFSSAARIGPLTVTADGESSVAEDYLVGFLPGEPVALLAESFRRMAAEHAGFPDSLVVGYAQDHEGYLLPAEDWLLGGYEPNITLWGPIMADEIAETLLEAASQRLGDDVLEPLEVLGDLDRTTYADRPLDTTPPDVTPDAGTVVDVVPETLWTPYPFAAVTPQPAAVLARVQGIAHLVWEGGDPGVDLPHVTIEREVEGAWEPLLTPGGRPVDDSLADVLLALTSDPPRPHEDPQRHLWWAAWQVVASAGDRAGLPTGTYRLKVDGQRALGQASTWPWDTEPYSFVSNPFEVVPATLDVDFDPKASRLSVSLPAPADGYRLVHLDGSSVGDNPVGESVDLSWDLGGSTAEETLAATTAGGRSLIDVVVPKGAVAVTVTDPFGNTGTLSLL